MNGHPFSLIYGCTMRDERQSAAVRLSIFPSVPDGYNQGATHDLPHRCGKCPVRRVADCAGFVLRQRGWFADTFAANISRLIMNIALPASIFVSVLTYLHRDQLAALSDGLIYGVASLLLGYPMAWLMVKVLKVRPGRRGVFINTIVNANTIFIGLPLNVALFGDAAMPYFSGLLRVEYGLDLGVWGLSDCPRPAARTIRRTAEKI